MHKINRQNTQLKDPFKRVHFANMIYHLQGIQKKHINIGGFFIFVNNGNMSITLLFQGKEGTLISTQATSEKGNKSTSLFTRTLVSEYEQW